MQKYTHLKITIPKEQRAAVNDTILMLIDTGEMQGVTAEEVFNSYTGIGGLHGLTKGDYDNFHKYTEAKKEIEQGQFFTPISVAGQMASLIDLKGHEFIADLTSGTAVFCNFFPEHNFYGCEIDNKAHKVAKFLYPNANLSLHDIRYWKAPINMDYIIGNPPFNLKWDEQSSQDFYFTKANEILRPGGIILVIVPASFCADPFDNKREIEGIEENFNFLCQVKLAPDAFKEVGVTNFSTKIMAWQKKCTVIPEQKYSPACITWNEAAAIFETHKKIAREIKIKANAEMQDGDKEFMYKVRKYLYEIKAHPSIKEHYSKAYEYYCKYINQRCPDNMPMDEWIKRHRTTPNDVLYYLRRIVNKQSARQVDKLTVVKTTYGFRVKAYSDKAKHRIKKEFPQSSWDFNDIVFRDRSTVNLPIPAEYGKLIARKKRAYATQTARNADIVPAASITAFVSNFTFKSKGNPCHFNLIQSTDLGKILTKQYGILNWQQGSGKTGAAYAWMKYNPCKKTFIISSALAINLTWQKFMKAQGEKFVIVKSITDLTKIAGADYVLLTHGYLIELERHIKKIVKRLNGKVNLVLDESDEITNHLAKRTRAIKSCFQKVHRKLLTTGTTTRNNIAEIYPQLELLYNNSVHMVCTCQYKWLEDDETKALYKIDNDNWGLPYPAHYGNRIFKQCFNPAKTTVFGIQQHNQNLYNEESLRTIIEYSIITRKFKEIAGDKYTVINRPVSQAPAERHVYRTIINEFYKIVYQHFQNTGNSRKESHLKIIRQIQLLIKATSLPNSFAEYDSSEAPNKAKAIFEDIAAEPGKIAIGCITTDALQYYVGQIQKVFPARPVYVICGDITFKKREQIIEWFQASNSGILICTQQSLKSSVNIPKCNLVFIESLQWNIPTIEQFYFRFIRYDSPGITTVKFFNYHETIEANLLALLMAKEKLNDFIKTLVYRENEDMYGEYGIDMNILNLLISKGQDEDGHVQLNWGKSESITN